MNENWIFGGICSVVLHAVGLGLLIGYGGAPREAAQAADEPPPSAEAAPADAPPSAPVRPAGPPAAPARDGGDADREYVVKPGDNLTRIARENGTTPEALAELNGKTLRQMNLLRVGQRIRIRE